MIDPVIPSIITHQNMEPLLEALKNEPEFQCGFQGEPNPAAWYRKEVVLEMPAGELARGALINMAIVGKRNYEVLSLTGLERFNAQGLEGKVRVKKDLIGALLNLRDIIPEYRGRILTRFTDKDSGCLPSEPELD